MHTYLEIQMIFKLIFLLKSKDPFVMCCLWPAHISDGWIQLTAISRTNSSQHIQLSGKPMLPWRCEALEGTVEVPPLLEYTVLKKKTKTKNILQHNRWQKKQKKNIATTF